MKSKDFSSGNRTFVLVKQEIELSLRECEKVEEMMMMMLVTEALDVSSFMPTVAYKEDVLHGHYARVALTWRLCLPSCKQVGMCKHKQARECQYSTHTQ